MSKEVKSAGLGLPDLVSLAAGQVIGAGVVTLIGTAISVTGMSAWPAFAVAVVVGFISIIPFIFLSSTVVLKGGDYSIVNSMIDDRRMAGFFAFAFLVQCIALSLLGTSLGNYMQSIFPWVNKTVVAIIAVSIFYVTNLMGVNVMAKVQRALTIILIVALVIFCVVGFGNLTPATFDFTSPDFFSNGPGGFLSAISLYTYSTYGQYTVINYSKDAKNPKKDIPLAIIIASGIILVLYVCIGMVACGVLPLEQVANQPLTLVAQAIFGNRFAMLFVIGGPIMALATTLNSTFAARTNVLRKATEDGWYPQFLAKKNRFGTPYLLVTFIYLFGILPLIAGWSIKVITGNLVLVSYVLRMITAMAVVKMPQKFSEDWKQSMFHVSDGAFKVIMAIVFLSQLYMIWITLKDLPLTIAIINIVFMIVCLILAIVRLKSGAVSEARD